jgi:hypothetical protein
MLDFPSGSTTLTALANSAAHTGVGGLRFAATLPVAGLASDRTSGLASAAPAAAGWPDGGGNANDIAAETLAPIPMAPLHRRLFVEYMVVSPCFH